MRRGVTWPNGVSTIGTPKSMAGIRDVHIPPHLIATVSAHLERHIDTSPDGLLFRAVRGGNMHPRTFGKLYDNARKEVGRPDLRFHDLRPVSYTHLDVYKRQDEDRAGLHSVRHPFGRLALG